MKYPLLSQMVLMWLLTSAAVSSSTSSKLQSSCLSSCSQLQSAKTFRGDTCSCSKSCRIYGDCCKDAAYNNTGRPNLVPVCVTLNRKGPVSLVNSCSPSPSSGLKLKACSTGLKSIFPVTSKSTGISYSTYSCALCNGDSFNLVSWPVRLRCCENGGSAKEETSVTPFSQHEIEENWVESLSEQSKDFKLLCNCTLYAENDDLTFANSLDLRKCVRDEISQCSPYWSNQTTRNLCSSYLDPVLGGGKVYRNEYCAQCNGEQSWEPKCLIHRNRRSVKLISMAERPKHKADNNKITKMLCDKRRGCPISRDRRASSAKKTTVNL